MDEFLTRKYRGLEIVSDIKNPHPYPRNDQNAENESQREREEHSFDILPKRKPLPISQSTRTQNSKPNGSICKLCEAHHTLRECPSFTSLEVTQRINFVKNNGCCYNCLAISHCVNECTSTFNCRFCGGRHNSLLHSPISNALSSTYPADDHPTTSQNAGQSFSTHTHPENTLLDTRKRLLGTAVFNVEYNGSLYPARGLIDPASDYTFISDQFRRKLNLPTQHINAEISGLNGVVSARSNQICAVTLRSNTQTNFTLEIQAIVVKALTPSLPTQNINPNIVKNLKDVELADQSFYESRPIDFLIGSDFYPQILKSGVKNILNTLIVQETQFGWILTGPVEETRNTQRFVSYFSTVTLPKCVTPAEPDANPRQKPKIQQPNKLLKKNKWKHPTREIEVKEQDSLSPYKWLLGRVIETMPGSDGRVKLVELRTTNDQTNIQSCQFTH